MKRLLLIAVAGLTLFAACDKDEEASSIEIVNGGKVLNGTTVNMKVWDQAQIGVRRIPNDSESLLYTWSSSDQNIASIEPYGPKTDNYCKVTALLGGEADITVSSENGLVASYHIVVDETDIKGLKFSEETYEVDMGGSIALSVDFTPKDASFKNNLVFKSSDETIAKVDKNGAIETCSVGECNITVQSVASASNNNTITATCKLIVKEVVASEMIGDLAKKEINIVSGDSYAFDVKLKPENTTYKIEWKSSNNDIATIDNKGTLMGYFKGECTITASTTNPDVKHQWKVTVAPDTIESGSINNNTFQFEQEGDSIKWTSDNEDVAKFDSKGKLRGFNVGECTITATAKKSLASKQWSVIVKAMSLKKGGKYKLELELPKSLDDKKITWTSSNEKIVTVKDGEITGEAAGECTITAVSEKDSSIKAQWVISVVDEK